MTDPRRALPSVGALLESDAMRPLIDRAPRAVVVNAIRSAIDVARLDPSSAPDDADEWVEAVTKHIDLLERPTLLPVFNATGVVLHTNLGRAPLASAAIDAIRLVAEGYATLEYDLATGTRGSRSVHCSALLAELTGADDAMVVNNCAAAVVLALATFAAGREAIISRGELIEIGGSFRVPDIMGASGARLREVGTTNRTHASDYSGALGADSGAIVKVHRSNFEMSGFVADASVAELAGMARDAGVPLIHDFGSGLMVSLEPYGLSGEPTAAEVVRSGATVVLMSGDKLFGGPQAGLIMGDASAIAAMRQHPFARAVRVDKLTIAALHATLLLYRDPGRAVREIPALAMITASASSIHDRAATIAAAIRAAGRGADVRATHASVGGGAFPTARIPSFAVALADEPAAAERRLRAAPTPVIGRLSEGALLLDLRSVSPRDDAALLAAVTGAL